MRNQVSCLIFKHNLAEPDYLIASSVSVCMVDLPNLIEVGDSDDESDTGSVKEIEMTEDDNEKKHCKQI